jgi:hypothetical protein
VQANSRHRKALIPNVRPAGYGHRLRWHANSQVLHHVPENGEIGENGAREIFGAAVTTQADGIESCDKKGSWMRAHPASQCQMPKIETIVDEANIGGAACAVEQQLRCGAWSSSEDL